MDNQQAKEILRLYRPGTADETDPQFAEALQCARREPELAAWLANQSAVYLAVRGQLKKIPVPADLKQTILQKETLRRRPIARLSSPLLPWAAAAAIAFLAVIAWFSFGHSDKSDFLAYRDRIVRSAQRGYAMTLNTTNLAAIHEFILQRQFPDYTLTPPLAKLDGEGCATLAWHDRKVSMICLNARQGHDLYLFVLAGPRLAHAPAAAPEYAQIHRLKTASWTAAGKTYILAGPDDLDLKQYLD